MPKEETKLSGIAKKAALPYELGAVGKLFFVLFFVVAGFGFTWYFVKYQKAAQQISFLSSPEGQIELNKQEVARIISEVSRHIVLPEGQTPTIANIQDAESLIAQQPFFAGTQNGDVVLFYTDKVFVYSPARDRLLNVGPLYFQDEQGRPVPPPSQGPQPPDAAVISKVRLDIRNGSKQAGVAQSLAQDLIAAGAYEVVNIVNAANSDYTGTVLVNVSGGDVSALEERFGVSAVSSLPENEAASPADVVIIIGG